MPLMPSFLDIATLQLPFNKNLDGALRDRNFICCQALSTSFTSIIEKRLSTWKPLHISKKTKLNEGNVRLQRRMISIKAVATLEPKTLSLGNDGSNGGNNCHPIVKLISPARQVEPAGGDSEDVDEREKLRRIRISKANKGKTPWNKGRKHSPETLQRIRERTRLAMQNPKVKMKLVNLGHAQSKETRVKIAVGVRMGWQRRREKLMVQEGIHFEWQNLIAEASRRGCIGQEQLQWDSYQILSEKLQKEWLESVEKRKTTPRPKGNKRAPKSAEQRRKIAEAIAAKWADPEYRERVCSGLAKYHGPSNGAKKKPRRNPIDSIPSTKQNSTKKKATDINDMSKSEKSIQAQWLRMRKSNKPLYKDPLASSKLQMIKKIRAERAAAEAKKVEAIERARLLIAEAEKAAKALEVAALKSPVAHASLIETRKLIAEAIQSIEAIEAGQVISNDKGRNSPAESIHSIESTETAQLAFRENGRYSSAESTNFITTVEKMPSTGHEGSEQADKKKVNGTQTLASDDKDLGFDKFSLQDILNSDGKLLPARSSEYGLRSFDLESLIKQSEPRKHVGQLEPNRNIKYDNMSSAIGVASTTTDEEKSTKPVTKRWVRGRLVEVTE